MAHPDGSAKRVLIIEDEDNWFELLSECLENVDHRYNCRVVIDRAADLRTALGMLESTTYDLITIDHELVEVRSGHELARAVNLTQPKAGCVVVSGKANPDEVRDFILLDGADDFFSKGDPQNGPFRRAAFEERSAQLLGLIALAQPATGLQLIIEYAPGTLTYRFWLNGATYTHKPVGQVRLLQSPADRLHARKEAQSRHVRPSADERKPDIDAEYQRAAQSLGREIWRVFFPTELTITYPRLVTRHGDSDLTIITDDPHVPWELAAPDRSTEDDTGFTCGPLCQIFDASRWPMGRAAPKRHRVSEARFVDCGCGFRPDEREVFERLAGRGVKVAVLTTANETLAALENGAADLYHFSGHGQTDKLDASQSHITIGGQRLTPADLMDSVREGIERAQPAVFLNFCGSAHEDFGLAGIDGWPRAFLACGASAVIGAAWDINDALAPDFAVEFYRCWLGLDGYAPRSLARAVREARLAVRALDPANPTWLAYVLYGHPDLRCALGAAA